MNDVPTKMKDFLNVSCTPACTHNYPARTPADFCIPRRYGDGRCDEECQFWESNSCMYDKGDCIQLCFADELANCSYDKLYNNKCDEGCNNKYCAKYLWGRDLQYPMTKISHSGETLYTDTFQCVRE